MKTIRNTLLGAALVLLAAGCAGAPERGLPPPTALERRGETLLAEGRAEEARVVFDQALSQRRAPYIALIGLARSGLALRDGALFDSAITQALAVAPRTPEAMDLSARTLLLGAQDAKGEKRRQRALLAATLFSQAHVRAPDLPSLAYHAGIAEVLAGRPEIALPMLEAAHAAEPASQPALEALVQVLKENRRPARIRELLEPLEAEGRLPPGLVSELQAARSAAPPAGAGTDHSTRPASRARS